jgi:anaerobic magnesium-protoporphyrin IX monomethyl ester cyclase
MKELKVLLVSPKSYEESAEQKLTKYYLFPYSIVYLVNYLRKERLCDVNYMDLAMEAKENLYQRVAQEGFDLIGFTSTAEARFSTIDHIKQVCQIAPRTKIVVGGHFFSQTAEEALRRIPQIDFVVRGEGELTLADLVCVLAEGRSTFESIDGLSYRVNHSVIHNVDRKPEPNFERFQIDYGLIMKTGYDLLFPMKNWEEREDMLAFPIMLGRGCNQKCIFCIHRYLPYRTLKLEHMTAQIDWAIERVGTRHFMFTDPSFSERKGFITDLCHYLIDKRYGIRWYCETRADVSPDVLRLMSRAGCISVDFALESGSERVLRALEKRIKLSDIESFARTCQDLGIRASFFTMVSLPEEKEEDFLKTYEMILLLLGYGLRTSLAPLIIYPGTELEILARDRGILPSDFSWYDRSYRCPYGFISPRERTMPHYLEHLSEKKIKTYLQMVGHLYQNQPAVGPSFGRCENIAKRGLLRLLKIRSFPDAIQYFRILRGYFDDHVTKPIKNRLSLRMLKRSAARPRSPGRRRFHYLSFGFIPTGHTMQDVIGRFKGAPNLLKRLQGKELLSYVTPEEGKRILDFGCGGGFFTYEFGRYGAHTIGLDIIPLPKSLKVGKSRVDFLTVSPEAPLPFPENFFDRVLLSEVIVVLSDPKAVMQELHRVLKENGRIIVINTLGREQIKKAYEENSLFLRIMKRMHRNVPETYEAFCSTFFERDRLKRRDWFSLQEIESLLHNSGFVKLQILFPFPKFPFSILYWIQFWNLCAKGTLSLKCGIFRYLALEALKTLGRKHDPSTVVMIGEKS